MLLLVVCSLACDVYCCLLCMIYRFGDRFDVRCLLNDVWCKLFVDLVGVIVVRCWLCVVSCRTLLFVDSCLMRVVGYRVSVVVRFFCVSSLW